MALLDDVIERRIVREALADQDRTDELEELRVHHLGTDGLGHRNDPGLECSSTLEG